MNFYFLKNFITFLFNNKIKTEKIFTKKEYFVKIKIIN